MAKQNVFGGKSKKFVFLFLSMVACVLSSLGVISASIQEATPVSADAPTATHSCIGITFIDQKKELSNSDRWTASGKDPYIYIYSVSEWASDSPYSSFSDFSTPHDGLGYDSTVDENGVLYMNATWYGFKGNEGGDDRDRMYTLQIPWYIKTCSYLWKSANRGDTFHTDQKSVTAGNTYADYLWGITDTKGSLSHETNPGEDNHSSSTWSGTGTSVTEYAVIDGVYNAEKIITTSNVIQNSIYTVSESSNIGSTITFDGDTYLLDGYYTNSTLTSSTVTSVNVETNVSYDLYARLVTPAVYFLNGPTSGWGSIWSKPKMTTSDGGLTYSYTWTVSSLSDDGGLFKICDRHTASTSWCGTYVSGSNKVSASGDNFVVSATGTYTVVYTVSGNTFTVHEPAATVDVYYVVCGVKGATRDTTRAIYPNEPIAVFADIDPDDIGYNSDVYYFTGWYLEYDNVQGVTNQWTSAHSFAAGDSVYVGIEKKSDALSEGIYLVNEDTGYDPSTNVPASGKMYYQTGSGRDAKGDPAPTTKNPYMYYLTKTFSENERFVVFDNEHFADNERVTKTIVFYNSKASADVFHGFFAKLDGLSGYSVCGIGTKYAYRCLVPGTYTIYYGYSTSTIRGMYNVVDASETASIYFIKNTASWDNVYCYIYNSTTKLPAGGSPSWPGTKVGDSDDMTVEVTGLIKTKQSSQTMCYIYKVTYYPSMGSPNDVIFNNGKSDGTETAGVDKTRNMTLTSGNGYYFTGSGDGSGVSAPRYGVGFGWLFDFEEALGTVTYKERSYSDSICAIMNDSTTASDFYSRYTAMGTEAKAIVDNATIETYTNVEVDNTTTGTVAFTTIIAMLAEVVGGGASARISAPGSASSPLTVTLWIVLGSGSVGIGLILGAYLVSKKKKKHRA